VRAAGGASGQKSRHLSLIRANGMVCQYSRPAQVSSEKHETAAEAGGDLAWSPCIPSGSGAWGRNKSAMVASDMSDSAPGAPEGTLIKRYRASAGPRHEHFDRAWPVVACCVNT